MSLETEAQKTGKDAYSAFYFYKKKVLTNNDQICTIFVKCPGNSVGSKAGQQILSPQPPA